MQEKYNDPQSVVDFLKTSRLFQSFSDDVIGKLSPHLKVTHFPESSEIIREGEINSRVFFLIRGKIAIYTKEKFMLKLKRAGDMCGEMSFVSKKPFITTEIAYTDVDLFSLDINDINKNNSAEAAEVHNLLFRLFSIMLNDKLSLATGKVKQYETIKQQLKQSNQRLVEVSQDVESANIVKREFLEIVNHELRTPLNGVIGMTDLLLDTELSANQKEIAMLLQQSANTLLKIITDVLDHTNLKAGELEIKIRLFNLNQLVDDVIREMDGKAREKLLELSTQIASNIPDELKGDQQRIKQVLFNLVGNAIKFTKEGKVIVQIKLEEEFADQVKLWFGIKDTGIGIPAGKMERLFKEFTQVDSTLTRAYSGTGLGLVLSKQLVEIMGGQVGVDTVEGQGSTFWFTLTLEKHSNRKKASHLDTDTLRQLGKSAGDLTPLIILFLQELPKKLAKIDRAIRKNDTVALEEAAHILKSNSLTFGALPMAELCKKLEFIGSSGKIEGTAQIFSQLMNEGEKVALALKKEVIPDRKSIH